jgi:hypothetical protein
MSEFRVCVIGNSHIAAVKQAWDNRAPKVSSDLATTFFSAQVRLMEHLVLDGRVLVPTQDELAAKLRYTSGGTSVIDIDAYDAFVLIGSGFGVDLLKFREIGGTAAHLAYGPVEPLMSERCYDAVMAAVLRDSMAIRLIRTIRAIEDKPALIVAAPYLSERLLEEDLKDDLRFHDPLFMERYVPRCRAVCEAVAAELGSEVVWQDEETVAMPGFTKIAYGLNPIRFAMRGQKPRDFDRRHGNEDYGHLVLLRMLAQLDRVTGGRVLAKEDEAA